MGGTSQELAQIAGGKSANEYRSVATNETVVFTDRGQRHADRADRRRRRRDPRGRSRTRLRAVEPVEVYLERSRIVNEYVDPANPNAPPVFAPSTNAVPAESVQWRTENYTEVLELSSLDRALTNTVLITILVVVGQVLTSIMGGYAFARIKFAGRDKLFLFYLGSIMIPFVVLLIPLYRLMVTIGWVNDLVSLVIPFVFTAYGTFLMRQFFVGIPKELEEAAVIDGASRWRILWQIFVPLSIPAIATLSTFSFLYAWNSFIWPLIILDSGNLDNNVLCGRAVDPRRPGGGQRQPGPRRRHDRDAAADHGVPAGPALVRRERRQQRAQGLRGPGTTTPRAAVRAGRRHGRRARGDRCPVRGPVGRRSRRSPGGRLR